MVDGIKNENPYKIEVDKFNSQIFSLKMGNLEVYGKGKSREELTLDIRQVLEKAKQDGYQHITCKIDTNNSNEIYAIEENGMRLADTLVTYRFYYEKAQLTPIKHKCRLGDCKDKDISALKEIAKKAFEIDRFHSDDSLNDEACDNYYETWIENSYNGFADRVIVAYVDNVPVGYTTAKLPSENGVGHLVLSAVSDKARGKGVYTSMIYEGVRWMDGKAKCLQVGTQINNVAVQKAWIKLGFTVNDSSYVFQKKIESKE